MELPAIGSNSATSSPAGGSTSALDADDFLQLLVTQLANQDPLEPTSNEALLEQLSSIRNIQLSTSLVDTMEALAGNQRYGIVAGLIGRRVTGVVDDSLTGARSVDGVVSAVRFGEGGDAVLDLDTGDALPLSRLQSVQGVGENGEELVGKIVSGRLADSAFGKKSEGLVTAIRRDDQDRMVLELDTGEAVLFEGAELAA